MIPSILISKKIHSAFAVLITSLLFTSCGTYQNSTYGDDGIYGATDKEPHNTSQNNNQVNTQPVANSDSYFSRKLQEYEQMNSDYDVLTDVEGYSTNQQVAPEAEYYPEDGYYYDDYYNGQPEWGANAQTNLYVYPDFGWGYGYNNYYPFWNRGFRNGWAYWNNPYYYGGYYGPYWGNNYWYGGFYWNNGWRGNRWAWRSSARVNNYRYLNARRSVAVNASRRYNTRAAQNVYSRNNSARSSYSGRTYSTRQQSTYNRAARSSNNNSSTRYRSSRSSTNNNRTYSPRSSSSRSYNSRGTSSSSRSSRSSSSKSSSGSYRRR